MTEKRLHLRSCTVSQYLVKGFGVKSREVIAIAFVGLLALATGACKDRDSGAQTRVYGIGFYTTEMNFYAAKQAKSNWCWAACTQMVLSAKGIEISQEDIVRRSFGSVADQPGSTELIAANLDGWQVGPKNRPCQLTALQGQGFPPMKLLIEQLQQHSPVIVALAPPVGDVGHAVVISAAVCRETRGEVQIESLMIRDPDPELAPDMQKRKLTAKEFQSISDYLILKDVPL